MISSLVVEDEAIVSSFVGERCGLMKLAHLKEGCRRIGLLSLLEVLAWGARFNEVVKLDIEVRRVFNSSMRTWRFDCKWRLSSSRYCILVAAKSRQMLKCHDEQLNPGQLTLLVNCAIQLLYGHSLGSFLGFGCRDDAEWVEL